MKNTVRIWDLPVRINHWLVVLSFSIAFLTHDSDRFLFFHILSGYIFGLLIIFRLIWGVTGTQYAKFNSFSFSFTSVINYLKGLMNGTAMRHIGHNPAGGWAIFIILILGFILVLTGILVEAGEENYGIFAAFVPYSLAQIAREPHEIIAFLLLALVGVHALGVIAESIFHKENLVWSMISGNKEVAMPELMPTVKNHHFLASFILLSVLAGSLFYLRGYITETTDDLYQPYTGPTLATNETWLEECSDCHSLYHPSLLPQRSWDKIIKQQNDHFGDELDLDVETLTTLKTFFDANSAEQEASEPARKINASIPNGLVPIRVTETSYWKKKHADIDQRYWESDKVNSKGNCNACHLDADRSTFEDSNMRLPTIAF